MNKESQNGNAIILILLAVGLFAALGYAFTNTSRTSTVFLSDETAKSYANQIIAYGSDVQSAVKRLQLRGCGDNEISFENNIAAGYTNPNAPSDNSCHVYDVAGGGLTYQAPSPQYGAGTEWVATGRGIFYGVRSNDLIAPGDETIAGVDLIEGADLSITLHDVENNICLQINDILQIEGIPIDSGDLNIDRFIGSYASIGNSDGISGCPTNSRISCPGGIFENSELWNKRAGCFEEVNTGNNVFYTVVLAR